VKLTVTVQVIGVGLEQAGWPRENSARYSNWKLGAEDAPEIWNERVAFPGGPALTATVPKSWDDMAGKTEAAGLLAPKNRVAQTILKPSIHPTFYISEDLPMTPLWTIPIPGASGLAHSRDESNIYM
jgi:hypothetical protein